jgi:hypothetical protein
MLLKSNEEIRMFSKYRSPEQRKQDIAELEATAMETAAKAQEQAGQPTPGLEIPSLKYQKKLNSVEAQEDSAYIELPRFR